MKIKNINVLKSAWILITLFYSSLLWAQPYSGGNNSGAFTNNSVAANCTVSRFYGGVNAGMSSVATSLLNCTTARFLGDTADGGTAFKTAIFDCTPTRFAGDTADGGTAFKTAIFDCTPARFAGDTADGGAIAKTINFDCMPERFLGDTSDGAIATATKILNCTAERFFGDTADGFAASKFLLIRSFLGNDTSVTIICTNDAFNLLNLYTTPLNLLYNWNAPTATAAGLGTYQLIATNQSGCVDTALAAVKQDILKWNGSVSNNWHTAANWDGGKIPDEKSHVIIPGGTANPCQIADADATAASVQAKTTGSFIIINNKKLLVSGTCISLPTGQ